MSQGLVERQNLEDIADAIRSKNGSTDTYTPAEMAQAISEIHTADEVVLVQKTVNANGQYNASDDSADGYSGVRVNVPNSYSASDEGKVVSNGTLVAQTSKNINANGTHDTTENNSVVVDVPNSYAAADEGKVVSGGTLVEQTSRNVTMNGTYDTTENNEVVVNVPTGGGGGGTLSRKATYRVGNENGAIVESELSQTIEMHNQSTDFIIPTLYGMNYAFKKKEPFEISCKFKLLNAPTSAGEQIWGGVNSYYHYPSIAVYPDKIVYFVTTNGSNWQYNAVAITPSGYTTPINTIITARLKFNGTNISFYVNDGSNEYTAELENVTPSGGNFAFEFGGQNRSQYSIAKLGCIIYLDETYIKVDGDTVWPVGVATLVSKTITQNGTYNASDDNADGYSSVTVNVSGGGGSGDAFAEFDFSKLTGTIWNVTYGTSGGVFNNDRGYIYLPLSKPDMTIEIDVSQMQLSSGTHRRFIMGSSEKGLIYRSNGVWAFYYGSWQESVETSGSFFDNSTVRVYIDASNYWHIYRNDVLFFEPTSPLPLDYSASQGKFWSIGSYGGQSINNAIIKAVRLYDGEYTG